MVHRQTIFFRFDFDEKRKKFNSTVEIGQIEFECKTDSSISNFMRNKFARTKEMKNTYYFFYIKELQIDPVADFLV